MPETAVSVKMLLAPLIEAISVEPPFLCLENGNDCCYYRCKSYSTFHLGGQSGLNQGSPLSSWGILKSLAV